MQTRVWTFPGYRNMRNPQLLETVEIVATWLVGTVSGGGSSRHSKRGIIVNPCVKLISPNAWPFTGCGSRVHKNPEKFDFLTSVQQLETKGSVVGVSG